MKKTPVDVRLFEQCTILSILLGWLVAILSYPATREALDHAFLKPYATSFLFIGVAYSSVMKSGLAFWVSRERSPVARGLITILFAFSLLMGIPHALEFWSHGLVGALGLFHWGLEGFRVYLLFTPAFSDWVLARPRTKVRRNNESMGNASKIALAVVAVLLASGLALFAFWLRPLLKFLPTRSRAVPAKILVGEGRFKKAPFYGVPSLGTVSDIAVGALDADPRTKVGVTGLSGAVFLDQDGKILQSVATSFEALGSAQILPGGVNGCRFFNHGTWGSAAALIDQKGDSLWTSGRSVNGSAAADLNGDGHLEFAVAKEGDLQLLDEKGAQLWKEVYRWIWHVEIGAVDPGQKPRILLSGDSTALIVLDEKGKELSYAQTPVFISDFCLLAWPKLHSTLRILSVTKDELSILTPKGQVLATWPAPACDTSVGLRAAWLQPAASPPLLAVVNALVGGTVLLIYDASGKIVFEETRPDSSIALAALHTAAGEVLLVGGDNEVWTYSRSGP